MSTHSSISTLPARPGARQAGRAAGRWAPLALVLIATFMVVLDFFIVNVALPSVQRELHASAGAIEWVVAGYALTSAMLLIGSARLGDRLGRRRLFIAGLALFTLASAACGAAGSAELLVAARLLQGVGAALLTPNVLAIIRVSYRDRDLARALGAYGLVMGLAAASGQLIGGALVQADVAGLGWRACFLINVPVGLAALALTPMCLAESRGEDAPRFDALGTALVTLAVGAVVLPLIEGRQHGWPAWTWISLASAPAILLAFVAHQRRAERDGGVPLLPPALLRERAFSAGLLAQLAFWCGQASFFLVLGLYLQQGRGMSALHAGLVFTVIAVPYVLASAAAPELVARHGRGLLLVGALVLASGHGVLLAAVGEVGVGGSVAALLPGLALIGTGMGLLIVPLATIVLTDVRTEHAGAASGVLSTMQNVGNALGVAVTGVVFFGALHGGYAHALRLSLAQLALLLLAVAALTRLLPARAPAA
jgi:EmrB/QacA subfamily drug resistance transporter